MTLPTLETDRFILRPLETSDIDLLIEMDTDPEVMRFLGGVMSEEQIRASLPLVSFHDPVKLHGRWCIISKETSERHGWVLIKPMPLEEPNGRRFDTLAASGIEIGYRLKKSSWGQGIATEASQPFLALQFETVGLDRLIACTDHGNDGSQKVLMKLGMRPIGETRAYGMDLPTFQLTAAEWRANRT